MCLGVLASVLQLMHREKKKSQEYEDDEKE